MFNKYLHNIAARLRVGIYAIDGRLNQFLLKVTKFAHVILCLLDLNAWITGDNTETRTWSIKQASIKLLENIRHLPSVIVGYNTIGNAQSVQVGVQ